jgi:beta-glucosidase
MSKNVFPKDFLWGAATASFQVEGGIDNCDWAQAGRDGLVPLCGRACDHYNRYEADFDILRELGHNAHRFSVEWARIEPKEGEFDSEAIDHYKTVLRALHERNITPLVTIWHFTVPLWFSETGGWQRSDAPQVFMRYAKHVVQEFGDLCDNYATMNEPMVVSGIGYIRGDWPPFYNKAFLKYAVFLRHMAQAHNMTYDCIKEKNNSKEIGIVKHTIAYSTNKNPINMFRAWVANIAWTHLFLFFVRKKLDFIGLNYYRRVLFGDTRELQKTDMGWNIDPEGIYDAFMLLKRYKKPIYVSEAGCADAKDRFRADYIRKTIQGIERAIQKGVDVRGYCYWSLLDNYEWAEGFSKRFGLVEVDYDTFKRTVRPSAYVYRDLILEKQTRSNIEG